MTAPVQNLSQDSAEREPRGSLSIRTLAMPADTNQYGDIFGGWLLGQMDIAGGIFAAAITRGRTATVAVDAMTFRKPVFVGDVMCIYTDLIRIGTTSIIVHVEAWVAFAPRQPGPNCRISNWRRIVSGYRGNWLAVDEGGRCPSRVTI